MMKTHKKRFLSFFSIFFLLFSFFCSRTFVYANANFGMMSLTNNIDFFNQIGNNLNSAFPSTMVNGYAVNYAMDIHKIEMELMQEKWNELSESQRQSYNNDIWKYRLSSGIKFYEMAMDRYYTENHSKLGIEFQAFKTEFLNFMDKAYDTLSNIDIPNVDLKQKFRIQVDTNLLNRSLDYNKSLDITLKNKFNILSSSVIDGMQSSDISSMSYSDLYYSISTEIDRANFLYEMSTSFPTLKTKIKPFTCVVLKPSEMPILDSEEYLRFQSNVDVFLSSEFMKSYFNDSFFPSLGISQNSHDNDVLFFPILAVHNFSDDYVSDSDVNQGIYQKFLNNAFSRTDQYVLCNDIVRYGLSYSNNLIYYSEGLKDDDYGGIIPKSIVSTTVQLPFSSSEDISKFREKYILYRYNIINRPVNYVIELGDLLTGKLDRSKPASKTIVADLPSINVTDFPLDDINNLPADEDVEKQKQKEKGKEKDLNTSLGLGKKELTDVINDTLTKLFVPSDTFFEEQIENLKSDLDGKIDIHYIDKIFDKFKNFGIYPFNDIYIELDGNRVKIFDFSFVRDNLSSIKKFTDPLFWLLLMLFIFNETHFLIRGSYPLTLRRGERSDN